MKIAAPEKCDVSKLHTYYTFIIDGLKNAIIGTAYGVNIVAVIYIFKVLTGGLL
jgi:hypothetical protein